MFNVLCGLMCEKNIVSVPPFGSGNDGNFIVIKGNIIKVFLFCFLVVELVLGC